MAEAEATHVWSFGPMTPLLFKQDPSPDDSDHRVRVVWSIPFPAGFGRQFESRFGVRILCGYGSTEQGLTIVQPIESEEPDALGVASPHYDVDIVDDRGLPVADGGIGEIVVRPREPASMMSGYLNRDADTVDVLRDLWFHTGDRATRNEAGFYRFVDRTTDSIRRRGENISAWEIESVVGMHPSIDEVAAIGVPSELGEHEVKLVVVSAADIDERALFDYCLEKLPYFMVPRYIEIVPELPKTPSLRIEKYRLREAGVTPGTWDRETAGITVRRPDGV
jgi:crotonobetaine/carnitine-CoA ligase